MSGGGGRIRSQIHLVGIAWLLLGLVTPVLVLALDPPVSSLQPSGSLGLLDNLVADVLFAAVGVVLGMRGWTWWLSRLRAAQPAQEIAPRGRRLPSAFVVLTCLVGVILVVVEIPFGVFGGAWVLVAIGTQWLFVAHRIGQLEGTMSSTYLWRPEPVFLWRPWRAVRVPWDVDGSDRLRPASPQ
jgi:hypothetical protein